MNFAFNIGGILPEELTYIKSMYTDNYNNDQLSDIINSMGIKSAAAQRLPQTVTTFGKFRSSGHTLFILSNKSQNMVFGILKVGRKRLFMHDEKGIYTETEPLCVLDFYVHESVQRKGYGKKLFDFMLEVEQVKPPSLAIDSPSEKMLRFLEKHYHLNHPLFASNNFVVYPEFFQIHASGIQMVNHGLRPLSLNEKFDKPSHNIPTQEVTNLRNSLGSTPHLLPHTRLPAMPTCLTALKGNTKTSVSRSSDVLLCPQIPTLRCNQPNSTVPARPLDSQTAILSNFFSRQHTGSADSDQSVVSAQQARFLREMPSSSRIHTRYSYLKAVQNHNAHRKLW